MNYNIISTGSIGNAVVINKFVLIDCGVPFKALKGVYRDLKLVLLTHIHGDHFNPAAVRQLARERPKLFFGCCEWLIEPLIECGVEKRKILPFKCGQIYDLGACKVSPVKLYHDVPNCGYRLYIGSERALYITDSGHIDGITAPNYDLYMIEANYRTDEIAERIAEKEAAGEYSYEKSVLYRHLSKEQADDFLINNMGNKGEYVYLHMHKGAENQCL